MAKKEKVKKDKKRKPRKKCKCGCLGEDWHECPYAIEIHGDHERKCNCCSSCERECFMDV